MANSFGKSPKADPTNTGLCVVGNLTIDVILRGVTEMPQWGQEVICHERTETVAGQAGALAFAASAMGIATDVVGAVGDDATGDRIRDEMAAWRIGVEAVAVTKGGVTPLTIALVRPDGERAFVSDLGTLPGVDVLMSACQWTAEHPANVIALVGTSNLPHVDRDDAVDLLRASRRAGALTVFDPGWDPLGWSNETRDLISAVLSETDLFLPNVDEAKALTGRDDLAAMLDELTELCPGIVAVKGGALGSYVVEGGRILNVRAISTPVDNAVGAGDVYDAAVIAGHLNGRDLLASLTIASAAASIYVGRRTDRFPTYEECVELADAVDVYTVDR
jgi:ribokinase